MTMQFQMEAGNSKIDYFLYLSTLKKYKYKIQKWVTASS